MQPEESWFGAKDPGGASRRGTLEMASWERDTGVALSEGEDCWAFPLDTGGSRWASGAHQELCREAVCSADARRSVLRLGGQRLLYLLGPLFVYLPSESL